MVNFSVVSVYFVDSLQVVYFNRSTDYVMSHSRSLCEPRMHDRSFRNRVDRGNKEFTSVISVPSCSINSCIYRQKREVILAWFVS